MKEREISPCDVLFVKREREKSKPNVFVLFVNVFKNEERKRTNVSYVVCFMTPL